jgi:ubiquinone/menaquinone biosynthesis C-methylase UbiE
MSQIVVEDVTGALRELRRVVTPGGRVVVWDVDWERSRGTPTTPLA